MNAFYGFIETVSMILGFFMFLRFVARVLSRMLDFVFPSIPRERDLYAARSNRKAASARVKSNREIIEQLIDETRTRSPH